MPLILLKICLVLGAKMNNKNRKGMIIVDKIGIALLVIIVIVIVLLFLFQSDLLASFRNLPGPGGDEDKEFDGVVDEDKKGSCPFSVASIKGDKIHFDSEEFGSDENVLYLKGDVAEATIYVLQESFNIDQLNYDDAVGRISGEKVLPLKRGRKERKHERQKRVLFSSSRRLPGKDLRVLGSKKSYQSLYAR